MTALDKRQIQEVYRKRAGRYNFTANLYYAIGFRGEIASLQDEEPWR